MSQEKPEVKVETPLDFQVFIGDVLQLSPGQVEALFEFGESKEGYTFAVKKRNAWLNNEQFSVLARAVDGIGGEYVKGEGTFRVWKSPQEKPKAVSIDQMMPPQKQVIGPEPMKPQFIFLDTDSIMSLPFKSRTAVEDQELIELAGSMQQHGILEPLLVRRKASGNYELIAGHRRLAAAKIAGFKRVPCVVKEMSDQEAYEAHFIENLQRKNLNDYEIGQTLDHLLKKFPEAYPTQEVLAARLGKSKAWVSRHLKMLELEKVSPGKLPTDLTERQAREILAAPEERREEVVKSIIERVTPKRVEVSEPATCRLCGLQTYHPIVVGDQAYCSEEHFEKAKAAGKIKAPSARKIKEMVKPKPAEYDIAEFECSHCGFKALIVHVDPDKHKFVKVTKA